MMMWQPGIAVACVVGLWAAAAIGATTPEPSIESSSAQARPLSHDELQALLNRLETNLGGLKTLQAGFVQEKHLAIFTDVVKSEGLILFERPDRVRFEITKPFRSVLVTSGKSVARYEYESVGWRKLDAGDAPMVLIVTKQIGAWLEGRFRDENDIYGISAEVSETPTVILTPREEGLRKYISSIRLRLDSAVTRVASVTICEPSGDYTLMTFVDEERNATLPASAFDTTAPAPVEVDKAGGRADEHKG
jgi:outer membrane lipoprotein-sorting protein